MFVLLLDKRLEVHHGVQLLWGVAQQGLEITDKSVDIPDNKHYQLNGCKPNS